ncbi:MAG: hypothetical protein Pg6B_07010 [Candidatus Azobacteroides pseudotrichonymphae]|jgi:hypothetical protein|nr:MAG: hypothetical protein Pg6B_07010 [Candidatus Azobacteroides pseudotrichonymphae]
MIDWKLFIVLTELEKIASSLFRSRFLILKGILIFIDIILILHCHPFYTISLRNVLVNSIPKE